METLMLSGLGHLGLFLAKALIIIFLILFLVVMLLVIAVKAREKLKGRLIIRNLNEKLADIKEDLLSETLSKDKFKTFLKDKKEKLKAEKKNPSSKPKVYVLQFQGDIQASAVAALREEVTSILTIAEPQDEVVLKLESGGGMVHAYGLAASQLKRIRDKGIRLTVSVDKIAASGGYLMASVANRILAAPFAIIGSIGVVFQMPNFHRVLQDKHVEFEQITAGDYKRTLTLFGKNTEEGREKLREELEEIHQQFKKVIQEYRGDLNIDRVATGEHWLAEQALELKLVDSLITSDAYLSQRSEEAEVFEIEYEIKKSLGDKLKMTMQHLMESKGFASLLPRA
jgi:serine protease SohB